VDKLKPHLDKLLLTVVFLICAASTIAWVLKDRTPPSWDPARVRPVRVGSMKVGITDLKQGSFSYTIGSVSGGRPIVRERFAVLATACQ